MSSNPVHIAPAAACFVFVCLFGFCAAAQNTSQDVPPPAPSADYRIGPGDLLALGVSGLKEFDRSVRVSNSGKIHVPYAGVVGAANLTSSQLETKIAALLRERGLINDPWVTVRVTQYRAQPVYVLGEVINPGQFVIKDEMYLIDLITLAGGFNEVATPVGYLYRRQETNPDAEGTQSEEAIPIDFQALNEGKRPELNVRLRGGDVLYVPQRRKQYFFVVGDVIRPGSFEMQYEAPHILASQAIAQAGGPLRTARLSKGMLVRSDGSGKRVELPLNFKAVFEGKQPDMALEPNDIIFIPGSTAKTLGYGLFGGIPLILQRTTP